jgi:hypothetical protein
VATESPQLPAEPPAVDVGARSASTARLIARLRLGAPIGVQALLFSILFLCLFAYLGIWGFVVARIWQSGDGAADVSSFAIYAGSALGGTLSGFFAFVLGIRKSQTAANPVSAAESPASPTPPQVALGITIDPGSRAQIAYSLLTTLAIWSYAVVGVAALATVFFRSGSSPDSVKAVASAFIGLVFALFNQVFQSPPQQ